MATKKAASKKSDTKVNDSNQAEARPIGSGKDPLAEGNTLVNPSNSEAETHYDVKERSSDVQASEIEGKNANERAEEHNTQLTQGAPDHETPNQDEADQEEAASDADREGR